MAGERRARLSRADVIDAAVRLADKRGLDEVGMAQLAEVLEIRPPSLYKHVESLAELHRELSLRGVKALGSKMTTAAAGLSGEEALRAVAKAWRTFAHEHPGLYAAAQIAPDKKDKEAQAEAAAVVELVLRVLAGFRLSEDNALHCTRAVRSALHGFVSLESVGGFGMPLDLDSSFDRLLDMLAVGLRDAAKVGKSLR